MKHTVKRLLSLSFVLILLASLLPMGALAADGLTDASTGSIVVENLTESVTASAYKLMDVIYDDGAMQPKQPFYTWDGSVASWIEANHAGYVDTANSNAVTEAFYTLDGDSEELANFYADLANAIREGTVSLTVTTGTGSSTVTLANLPMGNYLVLIEGGMKVYRPSTVNLIPVWNESSESWGMSEAKVALKASEPTITKSFTVGSESTDVAKVGDTVNYTVTATIPQYPADSIETDYQLGDKLPAGVTLDKSTLLVYGVKGTEETALTAGTEYRVTDGTATLTGTAVDLLVNFDYAKISGYDSVKMTYAAAVNGSVTLGAEGNTNTAYLDYTNDPYETDSWQEKNASTTFYSFGIDVTKLDENKAALAGAEFTLSANADGSGAMTFRQHTDGYYYPAADGETTLAVGADDEAKGKLSIHGIVPGTYYLTETKAPGGYVKLQSPVTVTVTESSTTDGAVVVAGENGNTDDESGVVAIEVANVKGFTLPVTGGTGTALFTAIGIALMGLGFVVIMSALRRRKRVS